MIMHFSGISTVHFRFWSGFIFLPVFLLLSKGDIFQRLVVLTFSMVCIGFQLSLASAISAVFTIPESNEFWLLMFILVTVMFAAYSLIIFLYSKKIFPKLLFNGNRRELLLYIIGAVLTYSTVFFVITITFGISRIGLLLFIFWSFFILCFAIINTNEKAKQRYDAEMAREIISSGRDYYQKINEMQHSLQILRHDYKYHLMTINQMLMSNDNDSIVLYLSKLEQQFSKNELPRFSTNTVINALLVGYAERCMKMDIHLNVKISLPDPLTIPDYVMCIILGNLLENAINISENMIDGAIIDLSLGFQSKQISIVTEISFNNSISKDIRQQIIEKNNNELVIKSIRAVTGRYDGEFEVLWNDKSYIAYVLMSF